ncbi:hypothetical protein LEP3755_38790 [Leptolyngbya sp. NIES-3755]|nr:hypothetical protein LEP3755_38790 [Leptolyngbya sp. NIES-3755]
MATLQIENLPDEPEISQEGQKKPVSEILQEIRNRRRVNPVDFKLPDSTVLIREDRSR